MRIRSSPGDPDATRANHGRRRIGQRTPAPSDSRPAPERSHCRNRKTEEAPGADAFFGRCEQNSGLKSFLAPFTSTSRLGTVVPELRAPLRKIDRQSRSEASDSESANGLRHEMLATG